MIDVESLAKELHEAGRKAVEAGATVNTTGGRFLEWDEISEHARGTQDSGAPLAREV